jgi:class 3 adenylate cyclase
MAASTPTVRDETLTWRVAGTDHTMLVGSPAWFTWLEGATGFAYQGPAGSFTARKETRQRGGWYWKAYRKHKGKLHRAYLGKSTELTGARLEAAAAALAALAEPEPGAMRHALLAGSAAAQHISAPPAGWPRGTVTFLFTDIVDSTRLWERYPQVMPQVLVRHDALVRGAITAHGGVVFKTLGDIVYAAFARASDALAAACAAQRALQAEGWTALGLEPVRAVREPPVQVRMALHTGAADARNGDYLGPPLSRVARILAASHGGQILLSHATGELVGDRAIASSCCAAALYPA